MRDVSPPTPNIPAAFRVLIADDSRDIADTTAELIQLSMPCEVETVYDGLQALRRAQARRPDALILDLHMPGMNGLEVARGVRQHFGDDAPYIVALTGRPDSVTDLPAIDRSFDRAFAKPLDLEALVSLLVSLSAGQMGAERAPVAFEFGELFARAARQVLPLALANGLNLTFDYRGPSVVVEDDPIEMHCGLHACCWPWSTW